jgi:CobQ-like glutamine amidotransferase family enzyme
MKIKICHLYPDLLNTYGDIGNLLILERRASSRGIEIEVMNVSVDEPFPADTDFLFCGGGQDFEQRIALADLIALKKEALIEYFESDGAALFICGGYQLLGETLFLDGQLLDGSGIFKINTKVPHTKRMVGNIVLETHAGQVFGFENHLYKTFTGSLSPFGKVLCGFGNNGEDGTEGIRYRNVCGTYLHGPLFSKNPILCDWFLKKALFKPYGELELEPLEDKFSEKARRVIKNSVNL